MTDDPVRVAVVGAGNMGTNHVRVYQELSDARLAGVVEPDADRARTVESEYGVSVYDAVDDLPEVDAASIAVPNEHHVTVARECIDDEIDVLVEKPLAMTVSDAEEIVEYAASAGAVLQVGHIERFNPVYRTLTEVLENQKIIAIEARRLGPFGDHLSEVNVIFDLMLHDVDIVNLLAASSIKEICAVGNHHYSDTHDYVNAQLQFDDGVVASLTASHVTNSKIRQLTVTTESAFITVDYQKQDISVQRVGKEVTTNLGQSQGGYRTENVVETPFVPTREPLKIELEHFLVCVTEGTTPMVSGADGRRAVELTTDILDSIDN